ncbi:MAG: ectoine synthase [Litoreibacter sp.]
MIIRHKANVEGSAQDASGPGWSSLRMLTRSDGMGFSLNETVCKAGATLDLHYKNHLEACYCLSGSGTITDLATGQSHHIGPGTLYALDKHDRHRVKVDDTADMILISVFNPALTGDEVHGPDGSYSA